MFELVSVVRFHKEGLLVLGYLRGSDRNLSNMGRLFLDLYRELLSQSGYGTTFHVFDKQPLALMMLPIPRSCQNVS